MFIFAYSKLWADLVVSQLRDQLGGSSRTWGYACLCVGRDLDAFIESNYGTIDELSGEFLHVFSMRPPPESFLLDRMAHAQRSGEYELAKQIESHIQDLRKRIKRFGGSGVRDSQIKEKVKLLGSLREAGMRPNEYADFLFFDFRSSDGGGEMDIDVIAAKAAPADLGKDEIATIAFFRDLSRIAGECTSEGVTADDFVKRATWEWDRKIALQRSMTLFKYVKDFIKNLTGK